MLDGRSDGGFINDYIRGYMIQVNVSLHVSVA
jgi:hypothetical protein